MQRERPVDFATVSMATDSLQSPRVLHFTELCLANIFASSKELVGISCTRLVEFVISFLFLLQDTKASMHRSAHKSMPQRGSLLVIRRVAARMGLLSYI